MTYDPFRDIDGGGGGTSLPAGVGGCEAPPPAVQSVPPSTGFLNRIVDIIIAAFITSILVDLFRRL